MNFGTGSTFTKGPSPSPGSLYKAHLYKPQSQNDKYFLDHLSKTLGELICQCLKETNMFPVFKPTLHQPYFKK